MVPTRPSMEVCTLPNRTWHYRWTLSSAHAPIYWDQNLFQLDTTLKKDPVVCTRAHLLRPEPFPIGHDTIDEPYRAHTRPLLRPEPCPIGHDTIDGPYGVQTRPFMEVSALLYRILSRKWTQCCPHAAVYRGTSPIRKCPPPRTLQ